MEREEIFTHLDALYLRLGEDKDFNNLTISEIRGRMNDARDTARFILMKMNAERAS